MQPLSEVLADLSRAMWAADTLPEVLEAVVAAAPRAVEGCQAAAIVIVRGESLHVPAATDDRVRRLQELQIEVGTGPSIEALRERAVIEVTDLTSDGRWEEWSRRAVDAGVRSMLGYRLFAADDSLGALDLFSSEVDAFDDDSRAAGLALAAHAAIAVANALRGLDGVDRIEGLENALAWRDVIGQAKGILMERHRVTAEDAFDRLRAASQARNEPVRDVARHVTETGELPG